MWKRLQNHVREKDRQIGNPVLVETTYDEDQLRHMSNVSDAQNATSPGAAPRPYNTLAPPNPRDLIVSEVPTVSSVYSQPSPREDFVDISPPSSPEPGKTRGRDQPRRFRSMRDVSPVDENRGRFKAAPRPGSNIPVLRKAPPVLSGQPQPANTQKFWGGKLAPNSKVRWDEYSGEPTSEGKPGQVSPGSYVPPAVERQKMGYQVSISGPQDATTKHATFGDRSNRITTKPSPVNTTPQPREPWKGASGRVEIVQPFKTKAAKQGISIPRKSEPQKTEVLMRGAGGSAVDNYRRGPVMNDTPPVAEDPEEFDSIDEPIKPTVPLKVGRNSPPRSLASPTSPHNQLSQALYSYPSPITPTHAHPLSENTEQAHYSGVAQQYSTPPNTKVVRKSIEGTPGSTSSRDNGPASRFSWTTYNTSTTYQRSPPPSPPPPLPTVSASPPQPESVASSILNRRRPVPHSDLPARKPVASISTNPRGTMTTTITGPPSPRPVSTFSTSTHKALPRPPTEISAADHADILQAQMDDLRLRRSNVNRLLSDLNKQAPPNPLVTDFRRMRLVEQRKKDFMDELAEIKVEEHDVGLRLHRAYKKREREDPNGSDSAIWVRRVTS